ncbi:His-Xaa-Ser system protein HxsD [Candidatus Gracilibacteria bacterium]|nr:His-Xaa-Ser system protein HxsD [Candidatus Gracilibacteria bacterium]
MKEFLKEKVKGDKFELLIDSKIFSKDIVLKAAYNYLDKGYFFFFLDEDKNIVLQFTKKQGVKNKPEEVIGDFSDELLSVYLRDKLEKDNKDIREKIVGAAIANSLQTGGFVEINTDDCLCEDQNQIDFDKDIDDILKEIENDPELKVDEDEIERILKEIEQEYEKESEEKPSIKVDVDAVKDVKEKFTKDKKVKKTKK